MGRSAFILALGLYVLMAAPAQSAATWKMIKFKGIRTVHLETYESRESCEAQAERFNRNKDGWKYRCRAR